MSHSTLSKGELLAKARTLADQDYKPGAGYTTTLHALCDLIEQQGEAPTPAPELVTPTSGPMSQDEHTAFILRVFMYLVEKKNQRLKVDLSDVMHKTRGRQLQIQLNGHIFEARTIADLIVPTAAEKRNMQ